MVEPYETRQRKRKQQSQFVSSDLHSLLVGAVLLQRSVRGESGPGKLSVMAKEPDAGIFDALVTQAGADVLRRERKQDDIRGQQGDAAADLPGPGDLPWA